jgi:Ca-activated chloride channel homolog
MSGRHQQTTSAPKPRRLRLVVAAAVVLVLVAGGAVALVLLRPSGGSANHANHSAAGSNSAGATHSTACTSGVALTVVAADAIAPVLSDVAKNWVGSHPVVDGACPTVTVRTSSAATEEAVLAKPDTTLPDVWIPDSSLWVQRLRTDIDGQDTDAQSLWVYPPVASSPLVLATTEANEAALTAAAKPGWAAAIAAPNVSMVDPTLSTSGLLTLLTAQSLLAPTASTGSDQPASDSQPSAPSRQYVNAMVTLARSTLTDTNAAFLALQQHPAGQLAFPASEQEVIASNAGKGTGAGSVTVYPGGKVLSLDFPVVQFAPPGGNPAQRDAAAQFVSQLSSAAAQQLMRVAGLRDADGHPLPAATAAGTGAAASATTVATASLDQPTSDQVADGLRVWDAASRESRTLLVIDVSGSMADSIGGDQSKIEFAADAEKAAIDFFPDTSSLGLWTFSAKSNPQNDWTQVVPLGPLGSNVNGTTRRQALLAASATLPGRVGGDTGLYNTVLGAFEAVRTGYDPAAANSVVLLTDGSNTQSAGVDLASLLSTLRSQTSAATPLPIITIAVGKDADVTTLQQISAATGGTTLTAAQPDDIRDAVLDALVNAG